LRIENRKGEIRRESFYVFSRGAEIAGRGYQLAGKGPITKDWQKWARKKRDEGNSALHEDTEPSRGSVEELWLFAELVLTHLFTLPHNVSENLPKT